MLVDSNILVYSINRSSPKHTMSQDFLQQNLGELIVAHQNIFETLRVLTDPKFPFPMEIGKALEGIEAILKGFTIICPDYRTHRIALELIKIHKLVADQIFDTYLVVTVLSNGIEMVATDNIKDFQKFTELKILNPFLS